MLVGDEADDAVRVGLAEELERGLADGGLDVGEEALGLLGLVDLLEERLRGAEAAGLDGLLRTW
jgi:hypothetical protein